VEHAAVAVGPVHHRRDRDGALGSRLLSHAGLKLDC
jgi:hypothetical protein